MRKSLALLTATAGFLATSGASAQTADDASASVPDTSTYVKAATTRLSAASLADIVAGQPTPRRPLARLRRPLCLVVAASDGAFAQDVAKRIVANAKQAGVPVRTAGCTANALVTFSDDAHAQLQDFRSEGGKLFKRLSEDEIDAVLASAGPAFVFQAVEATPRWGQGDEPFGNFGGEAWTKERSYVRTPEDLLTSLVVIENSAVGDLSATQVADYVTLRLLAPTGEVDPAQTDAGATILSLFKAPTAAPAEMTRFDRAYLTSLYTMPRTAFAAEVLSTAISAAQEDAGS